MTALDVQVGRPKPMLSSPRSADAMIDESHDTVMTSVLSPERRVELLKQLSRATSALDIDATVRLLGQVEISSWIAHLMMVITFSGTDRAEERLRMTHFLLSDDRFSPSMSHVHAIQNVEIAEVVLVKGKIDPLKALQSALDNRKRVTMEVLLRCPSVIAELDKPVIPPMTTKTRR